MDGKPTPTHGRPLQLGVTSLPGSQRASKGGSVNDLVGGVRRSARSWMSHTDVVNSAPEQTRHAPAERPELLLR